MTTPQQRLHTLIEERRKRLRLTQAAIQALGGPTGAWIRKLPMMTGAPDVRSLNALAGLDRALRWREGTSWSILSEDRTDWDSALIDDEDQQLLEDHDEVDGFVYYVAARLRAIPEDNRDAAMRAVLHALGIDGP